MEGRKVNKVNKTVKLKYNDNKGSIGNGNMLMCKN